MLLTIKIITDFLKNKIKTIQLNCLSGLLFGKTNNQLPRERI